MTGQERWSQIRDAQDDCLIALADGKSLPVRALQALPPWRALLLAHLAIKLRVTGALRSPALERGTVAELEAEVHRVVRDSELDDQQRLGNWWESDGLGGD